MDDLIAEFLEETNESLDSLDSDFITLEQDPSNKEIVGNIFRVMHTVKGTCGFLGLARLEKVAHAAENIMDKIRDGAFEVTPPVISLILEASDKIKEIVENIETTGEEGVGDDTGLIARLNYCAEHGHIQDGDAPLPEAEVAEEVVAEVSMPEADWGEDVMAAGGSTPDLDEEIDFEPVMADFVATEPVEEASDAEALAAEAMMAEMEAETNEPEQDALVATSEPEASDEQKQEAVAAGMKAADRAEKKQVTPATQSIRVGLDVLENLMQMVGELVLTRNQLLQMTRGENSVTAEFATPLQRLNQITSELQDGVMKTRMQPIGNAWSKFSRLVRDLSMDLGKKVNLVMIGEETELDRQMLDAVKDPLTHMVRNSVDHGLETPDERIDAGKNAVGKVTLNAYHEGGHIVIKITDDGRGLNVEKIKKKALENGMATEEQIEAMSDKQIYQFILKPGFSTAEKITAVSGRGVGMDVVVSNISKIGGTVEINSTPGKGSEFVIQLPLTLAIMPVLIVETMQQTFAIPQIRVAEIVRVGEDGQQDDQSGYHLEEINGAQVLRLRGRLLPLVSLSEVLRIPPLAHKEAEQNEDEPSNDNNKNPFVIVCEVGRDTFGVVVDKVFHTEEIVVKPVSKMLSNLNVYAGCTILGDGSVIMILDPQALAEEHGGIAEAATMEIDDDEARRLSDAEHFLIFKAWQPSPCAVPLELVSRLEEVDMSKLEYSGGAPVIQYRDALMYLTTLDPSQPLPTEGLHDVIAFADEGRIVGLVVEQIVDIVRQQLEIRSEGSRAGFLGTMIVEGKTTDLLDISQLFESVFSDWLRKPENDLLIGKPKSDSADSSSLATVLLVDDSPFFRKFMTPVLSVEGFKVDAVSSAKEALDKLSDDWSLYDLILTDIDMPEMNGLEFASACKENPLYEEIPIIALTSHAQDDLLSRHEDPGFAGFVSKAERDSLTTTIRQILNEIQEDAA